MLVCSGSRSKRVVVAVGRQPGVTEVFGSSWLCWVSGARGRAREPIAGARLEGGRRREDTWAGVPGGAPVPARGPAPRFEGCCRKWPRRELCSAVQTWSSGKRGLARWRRTWATAGPAKPETRCSDSGTMFSF